MNLLSDILEVLRLLLLSLPVSNSTLSWRDLLFTTKYIFMKMYIKMKPLRQFSTIAEIKSLISVIALKLFVKIVV